VISIRRIVGVIVGTGAGLALAALSALPVKVNGDAQEAMVRVAFSARPQRIETCRRVSDEELAEVPVHMRQSTVCEGTTASYLLEVLHQNTLVTSAPVHGGGLRRDRQLYVLRELHVPSGPTTIEVRLTRIDSAAAPSDSPTNRGRETEERERRRSDEVPPSLSLRESVTLEAREVLLVTYDQAQRQLRMMRGQR
jgi:hypothetical protein